MIFAPDLSTGNLLPNENSMYGWGVAAMMASKAPGDMRVPLLNISVNGLVGKFAAMNAILAGVNAIRAEFDVVNGQTVEERI